MKTVILTEDDIAKWEKELRQQQLALTSEHIVDYSEWEKIQYTLSKLNGRLEMLHIIKSQLK